MRENFENCLRLVLAEEGGYANHPKDPGGATMRGVTQRTYDAWRKGKGLPLRHVRTITDDELHAIYRGQYWDAVKGDRLPLGVDLAVFDYAVNSGPARAAKDLQRVVGTAADGIVGAQTLAALDRMDAASVVASLCDRRLAFVRSLSTWATFGRGWSARIARVKAAGFKMAGGVSSPGVVVADADDIAPKANPADAAPSKDPAVQGVGVTGLGGLVEIVNQAAGTLFGFAGDNQIVTAVAVLLIVGGVGITAYTLVRRKREGG